MARRDQIALLTAAAALSGCASPHEHEHEHEPELRQQSQSIISGRPSTDAENYAVMLESERAGKRWRCSGTLIDPRIVVVARHCILAREPGTFSCTMEGEPVGSSPGASAADPIPPSAVLVHIGASLPAKQIIHAQEILATTAPSICRDDLAFVVLEADATAPTAKFSIDPPRVGDLISFSGWGLTSSTSEAPPAVRASRDEVRIDEVGPGTIPARSFAIGAPTVCYGDSGGGAIKDGALVGVYSRIDTGNCELVTARNIFTTTAPFRALAETAYARLDRVAPWNVVSEGDAGTSFLSDAAAPDSTPAPVPSEPPTPPSSSASCAFSPHDVGREALLDLLLLSPFLLTALTRRRLRS